MEEKNSLQKFTNSDAVNFLLQKDKVTKEELASLTKDEKQLLVSYIRACHENLSKVALNELLMKFDAVITLDDRNQLWQSNHSIISKAIISFIQKLERMPSNQEIAEETGLSRQTIHKHLQEFSSHSYYLSYIKQYELLTLEVLDNILKAAIAGDLKAAKLYFEIISELREKQPRKTTVLNSVFPSID